MPIRHVGILAKRASTWPRDHFCRSTIAPRSSWPTTWNEFLPISIPITAIALSNFWDMACSLSLAPLPSILLLVGQEHGRTIPLSDMAAYPNSNQRALMITIEASRLLILPARGNLCPTIQQLKACPGLVSGGFEGGARLKQIGLFEMRRLEALSNTIFGVAMTLLAYDLPKASRFANAAAWMDLVGAYAQPVIALMISF